MLLPSPDRSRLLWQRLVKTDSASSPIAGQAHEAFRRRARWCGLLACGTAALLLLITLAGYVEGLRYLELAGDFRLHYLAFALLVCLSAAATPRARQRRGVLSLLGVVILINGWEVMPWLWPRSAPNTGGSPLKFAAFNVEASNRRFGEVRDWALAERPDVAMFCESTAAWADELKPLLQSFPHHVRIPELTMDIFSRHPVIRTQVFQFGRQRGFCAVELGIGNRRMSFVGAHACPRIPWGEEGFTWRTRMLAEGIGSEVSKLPGPVVLMGDLNATPWSPPFQRALRESGLKNAQRGQGPIFTRRSHRFPARLFWNMLDHCLVSDEVAVRRMWTGPFLGSDHRPILVEAVLSDAANR